MRLNLTSAAVAVAFAAAHTTPTTEAAHAQACEDDLYIGYYFENPANNPEDPTVGSVHLRLPRVDGPFSGEMFFTYLGCQTRNLGAVSGQRQGTSLTGRWGGTVDGTAQEGPFTGRRAADGTYSGTYQVAGGKQFIEVDGCVEYYIAGNGDWTLVPLLEELADDAQLVIDRNTVRWTPSAGAVFVGCQLIALDEASCNDATTTLWQEVTAASFGALSAPESLFEDGKRYAMACVQTDDEGRTLAFGKRRFDYPNGTVDEPVPPPVPGGGTDRSGNAELVPLLDMLLNDK